MDKTKNSFKSSKNTHRRDDNSPSRKSNLIPQGPSPVMKYGRPQSVVVLPASSMLATEVPSPCREEVVNTLDTSLGGNITPTHEVEGSEGAEDMTQDVPRTPGRSLGLSPGRDGQLVLDNYGNNSFSEEEGLIPSEEDEQEDNHTPEQEGDHTPEPRDVVMQLKSRAERNQTTQKSPQEDPTIKWVKSRLGKLREEDKQALEAEYKQFIPSTPALDSSMIKVKWDSKLPNKITDKDRIKHPGPCIDKDLQTTYELVAKAISPNIKILKMIQEGETNIDTLKEALTDGLEFGTQLLYDITKCRRENLYTREKTWMTQFPDFYKSEDNYDQADCHSEVFGKVFRNNFGTEIKRKAEEIEQRKALSLGESSRRSSSSYSSQRHHPYHQHKNKPQEKRYIPHSIPNFSSANKVLNELHLPLIDIPELGYLHFPEVNFIGGRLTFFIKNWEKITSDPFILNLVNGHRIGFDTVPPKKEFPPMKFNSKYSNQIQKLLLDKVIEKTSESGYVSPIFFKEKNDGSFRLILNLHDLNCYIPYEHFKMEQISNALKLVLKDDFFIKIDLKQAYDSVSIHPESRNFLQFLFNNDRYRYRGWPNGLSEAPRLFTKLLKPLLSFCRKLAFRMVCYLDDILVMDKNNSKLKEQGSILIQLLMGLGFVINLNKSILVPSTEIEFLGFTINSKNMKIYLTQKRLKDLIRSCKELTAMQKPTAREVSSVIGKMQAASPAVLPANLYLRHLQSQVIAVSRFGNWEGTLSLNQESLTELNWWINNIHQWNGSPIIPPKPSVFLETDASGTGWGAATPTATAQGPWTSREKSYSINRLELLAALNGLMALCKGMKYQTVQMSLDNVTAVSAIRKMGNAKSPSLNKIATQIWQWALSRGITLIARHIPGKENVVADRKSRIMLDTSDFQLLPEIFRTLNYMIGPMTIDLFANAWNAQLPTFMSWKPQPGAMSIDALAQDWPKKGSYAFPPFCLLPTILRKVMAEELDLVLVTPVWPTQAWYPQLLQLSVKPPIILPQVTNLIQDPLGNPHMLTAQKNFRLAAWILSGDSLRNREFLKGLPMSSHHNTDRLPTLHTTMHGRPGVAGVIRGKWITFQPLSPQ